MPKKSFSAPDEDKDLPKAKIDVVNLAGTKIVQMTYEPGWKWSEHIGPAAGTKTCQMHHLMYALSGNLTVAMDDGSQMDVKSGDIIDIPPGHDAWVTGDSPFIALDLTGVNMP